MKRIAAAVFLFASAPSHAGELYLDINGYSWHSNDTYVYKGKRQDYNAENFGLGLTYGINKYVEASAGFYNNSYYKQTLYGGLKIKHDIVFGNLVVSPGLNVGVATGYADTPIHADYYQIVIMPAVRVTYRGMGLTVGYVPRVEKENFVPVSTITAQVNILFGRR